MKKITGILLLLALAWATGRQQAAAQASIQIGPRVGYELGDLESLFVGADARIGLAALPVQISPAFDYYLVDDRDGQDYSVMQISINALYPVGMNNQLFTPYFGAGVGIGRTSAGDVKITDTGLNVLGGAVFGFGSLRPYIQAQVTIGDQDFTTVSGGLLFNLGG